MLSRPVSGIGWGDRGQPSEHVTLSLTPAGINRPSVVGQLALARVVLCVVDIGGHESAPCRRRPKLSDRRELQLVLVGTPTVL